MIDLSQTGIHLHRAHDGPFTQFQVLGERGSGTNIVRKTMEKNFRLERVEGLGWKHGFPHMVAIPQDLIVVCVVRNAHDWALSMHKRPWHVDPELQKLPFPEFIRAEWRSIVDRPADFAMLHEELNAQGATLQYDRHPITGLPMKNLFELRREKLAAMEGLANRGCSYLFVQMETFLNLGEDYLNIAAQAFDLKRKSSDYRTVRRRMGNLWNKSVTERPATPAEMTEPDIAFMRDQLDLAAEARFGYSY